MGKSKDLASGNSAAYVETAGDTITGDTVVATTTQVPLRIENTASNSLGAYLKIRDGNSTSSQHTWIGRYTNDTYIYSNNSDLGMKITNAGQVTMPNQPSFAASRSQGAVPNTSTTYIFANAYYNVGSHYNTSNGIFTAPVAGKYFFSVNLMDETSATHSNSYGLVMKNGGVFQYIYGTNPTAGTHHRFTWAGVIDLAANDTINVNSGNITWYGAHNDYTYFSGYLLG